MKDPPTTLLARMRNPFIRANFAALSGQGPGARLSILLFHRVLAEPDPLFPGEVDRARFDAICGWLKSWCNVLPLPEAVARLRTGSLPSRSACITFDDGYADNLLHAVPILDHHGLTATFFIASGYLDGGRMWNDTLIESIRRTPLEQVSLEAIGAGALPTGTTDERRAALTRLITLLKYRETARRDDDVHVVAAQCEVSQLPDDLMLSRDQVRSLLASGMSVGAHTVTHPILANIAESQARSEMEASRDELEAITGEKITLFAYPNGRLGKDYLPAHVAMARRLGFEAAVSTNPGASGRNDDLFQLARFTPWDRSPLRFGLRLAWNSRQPPIA